MCGHFGSITNKKRKLTPKQRVQREGILRGLALAMQERGTHSTGIACVNGKKIEIVKKAVTAQELLILPAFESLISKNNRIVIGHTRLASVGEKTDENAHPFEIDNIVGCHNGRIYDYAKVYPEAKVDSEAVFYTLNKYKNNVKKSFKKIRGVMALTWLNKKDIEKLYIMVDGNPLFLVKVPEIDTYFYCSTIYALLSVVGSHFSLEKEAIWTPKEDIVYELSTDFGKIKKTKIVLQTYAEAYSSTVKENEKKEVEAEKKEEEFKLLPATVINEAKSGAEDRNEAEIKAWLENKKSLGEAETSCNISNKIILPKRDIITDHRIIMNFNNKEMTLISDLVNIRGCCMCDEAVSEVDGFLYILTEQAIICMRCSNIMLESDYNNCVYIDEENFKNIENEINVNRPRLYR